MECINLIPNVTEVITHVYLLICFPYPTVQSLLFVLIISLLTNMFLLSQWFSVVFKIPQRLYFHVAMQWLVREKADVWSSIIRYSYSRESWDSLEIESQIESQFVGFLFSQTHALLLSGTQDFSTVLGAILNSTGAHKNAKCKKILTLHKLGKRHLYTLWGLEQEAMPSYLTSAGQPGYWATPPHTCESLQKDCG